MTGNLLAIYIFGSIARGERDARSDLDLLAVVEDGQGKVPISRVLKFVPDEYIALDPSISWYGRRRLEGMFHNGELFAWHLHAETMPLYDPENLIASLGQPSAYTDHLEDVASFAKVLRDIPEQLNSAPGNAGYELGLIYVCLRNIAMSASDAINGRPDFSRNSPFCLNHVEPLPISRREYELAISCRLSGQRGFAIPCEVEAAMVRDVHSRAMPWVERILLRLEERL